MKKTTIKFGTRTVVELNGEVEAIVSDGNVFVKMGDFSGILGADAVNDAVKGTSKSAPAKKEEAEEAPAQETKKPARKSPAKKTAKVEEPEEEEAEEEDEEPAKPAKKAPAKKSAPAKKAEPAKESSNEELEESVFGILGDLDDATVNEKKAVDMLVALGEDVDKKAITKVIKEFQENAELDTEDVAKDLIAIISGEEAEEEEAPAPKKKTAAKAPAKSKAPAKKVEEPEDEEADEDGEEDEGEEVTIKDLKEGDDIDVYFESLEDWFSGIVKKVARGKVTVEFEDGDVVVLNEEEHSAITRFAE